MQGSNTTAKRMSRSSTQGQQQHQHYHRYSQATNLSLITTCPIMFHPPLLISLPRTILSRIQTSRHIAQSLKLSQTYQQRFYAPRPRPSYQPPPNPGAPSGPIGNAIFNALFVLMTATLFYNMLTETPGTTDEDMEIIQDEAFRNVVHEF